jgi:hypothetical protein
MGIIKEKTKLEKAQVSEWELPQVKMIIKKKKKIEEAHLYNSM